MKFTRLQLALLCLGFLAIGSGTFFWLMHLHQEFIPDEPPRSVAVPAVSGNYAYTPIMRQDNITDFSSGTISQYTTDGQIRVNLNSADIDELCRIPRIGPATARRILEHRMMHGPFTSVDELDAIRGIGKKTIESTRTLAYIGEPEPIDPALLTELASPATNKPSASEFDTIVSMPCGEGRININTATRDELTTLPRIGPKTADRIVTDRETNGPFRDVTDLTRVKGIGPKTLIRIKDQICAE